MRRSGVQIPEAAPLENLCEPSVFMSVATAPVATARVNFHSAGMCGENIGVVDRMVTGVDCCNLIKEIVEVDPMPR
jgi:hypothetical protein